MTHLVNTFRRGAMLALMAACLASCQPPRAAAPAPAAPQVNSETPQPPRLAVPPPDLADMGIVGSVDTDKLDASVLHLGRLVVALGRTRMPDVKSEIGAGVIDEQGDGADWASWICYTVPHVERVWLESGAQGSGDFVGSVTAIADATAEPEAHCPALPSAFTPIAIEPDIWLRTQTTRIDRLYGANTGSPGDWRVFSHSAHHREDNLEFDQSNLLALKFANGRVVALRVAKQVTS